MKRNIFRKRESIHLQFNETDHDQLHVIKHLPECQKSQELNL